MFYLIFVSIHCMSICCGNYSNASCHHWYNVSLKILLWNGWPNLMNDRRELPRIWLQLIALRVNRSMWSIWFKSIFLQTIWLFLLTVWYKRSWCAFSSMTWCVILCLNTKWLARIWDRRHNKLTSFWYLSNFIFTWMDTIRVSVCIEILGHNL